MSPRKRAPAKPERPARGAPHETRARLVTTAATVFNTQGYDGTDSNKLANAAGYAAGTFYKHFRDKRELFLAVYEDWVDTEWRAIGQTLTDREAPDTPRKRRARAKEIVEMLLEHHKRWAGVRRSLRRLVAEDEQARVFYLAQRRRQLDTLSRLGSSRGRVSTEEDAVLLYTLERCADAFAEGELEELRLSEAGYRALLVDLVERRL
ncbi:MAG: helix-turn-helix domain-containing protein [Polyangiaceae bacterium]